MQKEESKSTKKNTRPMADFNFYALVIIGERTSSKFLVFAYLLEQEKYFWVYVKILRYIFSSKVNFWGN